MIQVIPGSDDRLLNAVCLFDEYPNEPKFQGYFKLVLQVATIDGSGLYSWIATYNGTPMLIE